NKRLTLYEKYTKKDVCRLLNWDQDEKGTMFGYRTKHQTTPIFITYHKQDDVELSVDYDDEFLNPKTLLWYTRNQRTFKSNEIKEILYSYEYDNTNNIFIKKDVDDGSNFYYLGKANLNKYTAEETTIIDNNRKESPIIRKHLILEQEKRPALYEHLIKK